MTIIRTIVVILLGGLLFLFWHWNDSFATINLGPGGKYDVAVPLVVLGAFLFGLLPVWTISAVQRMLWRRRLRRTEIRLDEVETELEQARIELLRPPAAPRSALEAGPAPSEPVPPVPAPAPPIAEIDLPADGPAIDDDAQS